jgi:tRNA (cmo5U34)-methyltransferase
MPTALDNGRRSPRKLLRAVVARLLGDATRQIANDPISYGTRIRAAVPSFDVFQDVVAEATRGVDARHVLDLGIGTGETARRVLELHPHSLLVGLDASPAMAKVARDALPSSRVEVFVSHLEEPLPSGDFDLVVSALAIHHLVSSDKADLFARVASSMSPGGVFVLGDVVTPERGEDQVTPIELGVDFPDGIDDQLRWLEDARLKPTVVWVERDLAVIRAMG